MVLSNYSFIRQKFKQQWFKEFLSNTYNLQAFICLACNYMIANIPKKG